MINVVGTKYIALNGSRFNDNQYSVSERHIDADQKEWVENAGGSMSAVLSQDFTGIIFTYDFLPVSTFSTSTLFVIDHAVIFIY